MLKAYRIQIDSRTEIIITAAVCKEEIVFQIITRKFDDTLVELTFESIMKVKQDLKDVCKDIKKGDNETYIFYDLREMYYHVNERKPKMTKFFNIKKYEDGSFEYKEGEGPYIAESTEEVEKILDAYIRHFRQK